MERFALFGNAETGKNGLRKTDLCRAGVSVSTVVSLRGGRTLTVSEAPEATVASSRKKTFKSQRPQCSKD